MQQFKISSLQTLYDFAKYNMNNLQYRQFQFSALTLPQEFNENNEKYLNIKLGDEQYFIWGRVTREAAIHFNTLNKKIINLKQWKLKRDNIECILVVIIYQLEIVGDYESNNIIELFVPNCNTKDSSTLKQERKKIMGTKQYEYDYECVNQIEAKKIYLREGEYYNIRGRVIQKSQLKQWEFSFYFKIAILPQGYTDLLSGIVWDEQQYEQIQKNEIYLFNRVQAIKNKYADCFEFKVNNYSIIFQSYGDDIPYTPNLNYQNIKAISKMESKSLVDLIAVVKQKIYHAEDRITYIVCDQSGSIYFSIWTNNLQPITKIFEKGDVIVIKNCKFQISDQQEMYLNTDIFTYLFESEQFVQQNIFPHIIKLKEWALQQQFQELSLSKSIQNIQQLKIEIEKQLENQNEQLIKSLEACCYISKIESENLKQLTYLSCRVCNRTMYQVENWYECDKHHKEYDIPKKRFYLNVEIKDNDGILQAVIPNQIAVQLLGINILRN